MAGSTVAAKHKQDPDGPCCAKFWGSAGSLRAKPASGWNASGPSRPVATSNGLSPSPSATTKETPDLADVPEYMNNKQFWDIIERSVRATRADPEEQLAVLEDSLAELPPKDVAEFHATFVAKAFELYSWDLWGAVYVLYDGCSPDCFEYLRSWVVAQGKDYFEEVKSDPRALSQGRLSYAGESDFAELFAYTIEGACGRASGCGSLFEDYPHNPSTIASESPKGQKWDEATVEQLFPDLRPLE